MKSFCKQPLKYAAEILGCLLVFALLYHHSQKNSSRSVSGFQNDLSDKITVMTWNVENLFDTYDDPATDDDDFTPWGKMCWDKWAMKGKIDRLAEVIAGEKPDIIGFAEIENKEVLIRLAKHPSLASLHYNYLYLKNSNDPRGIDVALMSRYRAKTTWHSVYYGSRYILHAKIKIRDRDLHLLVNHWRSRLGGRKQSEYRRFQYAKKCAEIVKNILKKQPNADIIVLGDFNDTPYNRSIVDYLKAVPYRDNSNAALYNLTLASKLPENAKLTNRLDQLIVSRGMYDKTGFFYIQNSCRYVARPGMCDEHGFPLSFNSHTLSGYSDHFPLLAKFSLAKKQ